MTADELTAVEVVATEERELPVSAMEAGARLACEMSGKHTPGPWKQGEGLPQGALGECPRGGARH